MLILITFLKKLLYQFPDLTLQEYFLFQIFDESVVVVSAEIIYIFVPMYYHNRLWVIECILYHIRPANMVSRTTVSVSPSLISIS